MEILSEHIFIIQNILILMICSAFFSGAETAFFSIDPVQLEKISIKGGRSSSLVIRLLKNPSHLLSTILLSNLAVNILFFCSSSILIFSIGREYGPALASVCGLGVLISIIIIGEILPKGIGINHASKYVRVAAYPIYFLVFILQPLNRPLIYIVEKLIPGRKYSQIRVDELKMLLDESSKSGKIKIGAKEIIEDIIELSDMKANEIMQPRVDMLFFSSESNVDEAVAEAVEKRLFYLPVYRGNEDNLTGFADLRELISPDDKKSDLSEHIHEAVFYPETKNVRELFEEMNRNSIDICALVDEFGGLAGTVTLSRVIEEILGTIYYDEDSDEIPPVQNISENVFRVDASLSMKDWKDFFADIFNARTPLQLVTLGGFVTFLLDRIPRSGDIVKFRNITFEVEKMKDKRISTVLISVDK